MSLNEQLLSALVLYGLPVLFGVTLTAAIGAPLPASLLLVAAGAFAEDGQLDYWSIVAAATLAAVMGDHVGYGLGRWGGRPLLERHSRWLGGTARIQQAEAMAARYGGVGVFLSRWLITAVGPLINLTSGIAEMRWPRFFLFDVAGELLWVLLYTYVGMLFSTQVQAMSELLGDLSGLLLGLVLVLILGWMVARTMQQRRARVVRVMGEE